MCPLHQGNKANRAAPDFKSVRWTKEIFKEQESKGNQVIQLKGLKRKRKNRIEGKKMQTERGSPGSVDPFAAVLLLLLLLLLLLQATVLQC